MELSINPNEVLVVPFTSRGNVKIAALRLDNRTLSFLNVLKVKYLGAVIVGKTGGLGPEGFQRWG